MTKVAIWYPGSVIVNTGNFQTASRLGDIFESMGSTPKLLTPPDSPAEVDVLIAIHSEKSNHFVLEFKKSFPEAKIIVILSGTDLYPELQEKSLETLGLADAIVALHSKAIDYLPQWLREKATPILQSALRNPSKEKLTFCSDQCINVAIASHIRPVKGVLAVAEASKLIPPDSRMRFFHAGGELDETYAKTFRREIEGSDRYTWLGELGHSETVNLIDNCEYLIIPSLAEGGAQVIGESIVNDTSVIATSIHGNLGLLGDDYPALFSPGDSRELAKLLAKIENSVEFQQRLKSHCAQLKPAFERSKERNNWVEALSDLGVELP